MTQPNAHLSEAAPASPRRPRRGRHRDAGRGDSLAQPAWKQPRNPYRPVEAVSADELEAIHEASLKILQEIGVEFLDSDARRILRRGGADVDESTARVRFDRGLVEGVIGSAPEQFTVHARNPHHDVQVGGAWCVFCTVGSAPNSADREHGRRPGNFIDFSNFLKLAQSLNAVHTLGGYPVEPQDLHASVRHLDALAATVSLTDKTFHIYSLGRERMLDGFEIVRIARGLAHEDLLDQPSAFTVVNANSPLRYDANMAQGIMEMARHGQCVIVTPFTLAGAMAPVTIAGACAQQNAEALAGLVLSQLVRPGAPFVYGGFTSNVDMRSGAPAFGTPESMKAALVGGQLARRYRLPYRSSNTCSANTVDAQAAYESVFSLWGAIMGGVNILKHGMGWMEGGLQASFEKFVLDADLLQMVAAFLEPLETQADALAVDAMREVGPGGHFFGAAHTQSRYRTAFFSPMISDYRNYETWADAGRPEAYGKANALYKRFLEAYEAPPLDPAVRDELDAFVARRKTEGGVATDY